MTISRETNKCILHEQFQVISVEMIPLRRRSIVLQAYVLAEQSGFPPKATERKGSGVEGDFTTEKPTNSGDR